jgi:hypothetical protein
MINGPDGVLRALGTDTKSIRRATTTASAGVASASLVTQRQLAPLIARIEHLEQELGSLRMTR